MLYESWKGISSSQCSTSARKSSVSFPTTMWTILIFIFLGISACDAISCYTCSSLDDNYCPDAFTDDDYSGIVPLNDCGDLHEAQHCVKTTGVTGGIGYSSPEVFCYVCDETRNEEWGCSDSALTAPLQSCRDVFDAQYCIKAEGMFGGSLGTRRFCSSRDMGNYCEYIKRPGDQREYRSCVFTCNGNGCNGSPSFMKASNSNILLLLSSSVLSLFFCKLSIFDFIGIVNFR